MFRRRENRTREYSLAILIFGLTLNEETFITNMKEIEKLELMCHRTRRMRVTSGRVRGKLHDTLLEKGGVNTKQPRVAESKEGVGERKEANEKHRG